MYCLQYERSCNAVVIQNQIGMYARPRGQYVKTESMSEAI